MGAKHPSEYLFVPIFLDPCSCLWRLTGKTGPCGKLKSHFVHFLAWKVERCLVSQVGRWPGPRRKEVEEVEEEVGEEAQEEQEESTTLNVYYRGPRQTIQLLPLQVDIIASFVLQATIHLGRFGQAIFSWAWMNPFPAILQRTTCYIQLPVIKQF